MLITKSINAKALLNSLVPAAVLRFDLANLKILPFSCRASM